MPLIDLEHIADHVTTLRLDRPDRRSYMGAYAAPRRLTEPA